MKSADRFLLAIIAGIVVLVVVALTLALTRTPQGYLPDATPGGVVHNYLLAIKQRDSTRAYGYLSPELAGYPPSIDAFVADSDSHYGWAFNRESATISVGDAQITGDRVAVTVSETRFDSGGLFRFGSSTRCSASTPSGSKSLPSCPGGGRSPR